MIPALATENDKMSNGVYSEMDPPQEEEEKGDG